jgi:hypothetical protein
LEVIFLDFVIISGDQAIFDSSFPPATVVPVPGTISASNQAKGNQVSVCVEGDESTVIAAGAAYTSGAFVTPGVGTLTIESLGSDQTAQNAKSGDKALILKGSQFRAKFQVTVPAMNPVPTTPVPDPVSTYNGTGSFMTTNTVLKAG